MNDKYTFLKTHQQELTQSLHGIEREALRVDKYGKIAQTPHPEALGAPLCHPFITTDYSEALLEFVTPTFKNIDDCLIFLRDLHIFTYQCLDEDELLWTSSMPCLTPDVDAIPVAKYGTSNVAKMKEVYRRGLGHRYGRPMQTISGVHYNFSFSESFMEALSQENNISTSDLYLHLVRNFKRWSWVLIYFFGASPAICGCFIKGQKNHRLSKLNKGSLHTEYATSLRMSDLGYQNDAQSLIDISLNNIDEYCNTLQSATETPYPAYEKIGLKDGNEYKQINTNILQIENEYYASIRPKQPIKSGEKPSSALKERGIAYVEVRCLDINPFEDIGISKEQTMFIDLLLTYCLFNPSPNISKQEQKVIRDNNNKVAKFGRESGVNLNIHENNQSITAHLQRLVAELGTIAKLYDYAYESKEFTETLYRLSSLINNKENLPSSRINNNLMNSEIDYIDYAQNQSRLHKENLRHRALSSEEVHENLKLATALSITNKLDIEKSDSMNFEEYLNAYNQSS